MEQSSQQKLFWTRIQTSAKVSLCACDSLMQLNDQYDNEFWLTINLNEFFMKIGYGFVDFESPVAAENAVKNLQAQGVQAQMAKVNVKCHSFFNYYFI